MCDMSGFINEVFRGLKINAIKTTINKKGSQSDFLFL
jgi:hypothetical protein